MVAARDAKNERHLQFSRAQSEARACGRVDEAPPGQWLSHKRALELWHRQLVVREARTHHTREGKHGEVDRDDLPTKSRRYGLNFMHDHSLAHTP